MLAGLLQEERTAVEALTQQLQREYEVLKTRNAPGLEQVVHEKRICADHLHQLMSSRLDYLRTQGFTADKPGLAAYIAAALPADRSELAALAADLESAAEQAHNQNEINGAVIAASRSYVERALTILTGRDPSDCLYDHGSRRNFGASNSLISKA
ncbi:MAG: flagellar protein FlgN [Synechococcaceae cyanobacterium SM1_2_3]|nr:flagellar protein FlgN [Synechococcaceae cyanobacterium SM1_2_3]